MLKLYCTLKKTTVLPKLLNSKKNCFQSGSFWVSQSHFFKGDRKVIALAAFKMQGCQSLRPRTSVGNTFRFCRESYWLGQNTVCARLQFWRFFKRIRGFSVKKGLLSVYSEFVLMLAPAFHCLSVPFHRCTQMHTHTYSRTFLPTHIQTSPTLLSSFFPVSALQTFHWMFYRVARNTKHVEEARGACQSSLIHLNATWQRFTLHQRQVVTLEGCLFFPQLIDCECPSLRSINHVFLDSAAFILCSA